MRITKVVIGLLSGLLVAAAAAAVEIPLKNGTTLNASSYRITGSYLMATLANGQRVAYGVADVDLEALQRAEAATEAPAEIAAQPEARPPSIMDARAAEDRPRSVVTITDGDVAPARPDVEASAADDAGAAAGPPPGYTEGSGLVINRLRVDQVDDGIWDVRGVIVNRGSEPARDVRVQIDVTDAAGEALASPTLELSPELVVGESASFSHHVETPERPTAKIRVFWLRTAQAPEGARTEGGGGPAPSGSPDSGGVQPTPGPRIRD